MAILTDFHLQSLLTYQKYAGAPSASNYAQYALGELAPIYKLVASTVNFKDESDTVLQGMSCILWPLYTRKEIYQGTFMFRDVELQTLLGENGGKEPVACIILCYVVVVINSIKVYYL